jgi:hypothetical protein
MHAALKRVEAERGIRCTGVAPAPGAPINGPVNEARKFV